MSELTCCRLCDSTKALQNSHVIPKFLYRYMHKHFQQNENGSKPIQFDSKLNLLQRSDRQWKERLFCRDCEQLLSKNETKCSKIFRDIVLKDPKDRITFAYSYEMDLDAIGKKIGYSKQDIEDNFPTLYFDTEKADIVRYFAISYVIRSIYLSREYLKFQTIC